MMLLRGIVEGRKGDLVSDTGKGEASGEREDSVCGEDGVEISGDEIRCGRAWDRETGADQRRVHHDPRPVLILQRVPQMAEARLLTSAQRLQLSSAAKTG